MLLLPPLCTLTIDAGLLAEELSSLAALSASSIAYASMCVLATGVRWYGSILDCPCASLCGFHEAAIYTGSHSVFGQNQKFLTLSLHYMDVVHLLNELKLLTSAYIMQMCFTS